MHGLRDGLTVVVSMPVDRLDRETPYVATVTCGHGVSRLPVKRTCRNGCHQGTDRRFLACSRMHPPVDRLRQLAAMLHGRRLGCGCDDAFWMREGPVLDEMGLVEVQVDERTLTDDEVAQIWDAMRSEALGWGTAW